GISFSCFFEVCSIRISAVPVTTEFKNMVYLKQNKDQKTDFQSIEPDCFEKQNDPIPARFRFLA
ncbi:MAG: hypothetical protein KDA74_10175, partial [Planctomycetaceae bacterium]|nr:hypothetical protein [Planctomycetaceae bacterium]